MAFELWRTIDYSFSSFSADSRIVSWEAQIPERYEKSAEKEVKLFRDTILVSS